MHPIAHNELAERRIAWPNNGHTSFTCTCAVAGRPRKSSGSHEARRGPGAGVEGAASATGSAVQRRGRPQTDAPRPPTARTRPRDPVVVVLLVFAFAVLVGVVAAGRPPRCCRRSAIRTSTVVAVVVAVIVAVTRRSVNHYPSSSPSWASSPTACSSFVLIPRGIRCRRCYRSRRPSSFVSVDVGVVVVAAAVISIARVVCISSAVVLVAVVAVERSAGRPHRLRTTPRSVFSMLGGKAAGRGSAGATRRAGVAPLPQRWPEARHFSRMRCCDNNRCAEGVPVARLVLLLPAGCVRRGKLGR